jgi:hypothetical protein
MSKYLNPPRGQDKGKLLLRFGSREYKQKIKDFIEFCKEGKGFYIA